MSECSRLSLLVVLVALAPFGITRAQLVGRIEGEFAVNARGAATYAIPLVVPPGTAGAQPALALVYDSQAPGGPFGVGFGLSGLSAIARCPRDLARDGERRAVAFDARDRLCLDGERLVLVSGVDGTVGAEYRTERDDFARIRVIDDGPSAFEVAGRDGIRRYYGTSDDSRIEAQGRTDVRVWALARTEDPAGNAVRFSYSEDPDEGEFALDRIDYTENGRAGLAAFASLRLIYEPRPDPEFAFAAGARVAITRRVASLEAWLGDERVREYRLDYETSPASGRSRIATITLCGLGGECLPPTRFTWEDAPVGWTRAAPWSLPRQLWRDGQQEAVLADVDGDGRVDFVHGGSSSQAPETWLNDGAGFARASPWRVPDDLFGEERGNPHALLVDVDGDDLPDYVRAYRRSSGAVEIATHLNRGDGFDASASADYAMPSFLFDYSDGRSRQLAELADVNGDGRLDWVQAFEATSGAERRETRLNTGAGFAASDPSWTLPARLWSYEGDEQRAEAALIDLNGDGLPDLIRACATPASGELRQVWLNTGAGFAGPVASWRPPHVLWDYATGSLLRQEGELADVNGDALPDLVIAFRNSAGSLRTETWLNTGAGWTRDPAWDLPTHLWSYEGGKHRQMAQLVDANGDGLLDVVQAFETSAGADRLATWINTGHGFPAAANDTPAWAAPAEVWSYFQDAPRTKGTFADVDGDGAIDFVRAYRGSSTNLQTHVGAGPADRLAAIADGLGGRIEIEYTTLADAAAHVAGTRAVWPEVSVRDTRSVVRRAGVGASPAELRWTAHRYGDLRAHRLLGIELGFAWHESLDETSGLATTAFYRQDWPLQGWIEREEVLAGVPSGAVLLRRSSHALEALAGQAAGIFAVRETESREETFELDGGPVRDVRTTREFDTFGNVTRERVSLGDGYVRTTETAYRNDVARWRLGLAERIDVTASGPGQSDQRRSVAQSYDPERGLLVSRTTEPDRPELRVLTEYALDPFGNAIARTTSGADFETRASATVYDERGRFAQLEVDALGHASVTLFDPRLGLPLAQLGPDPTVPETRFEYDALGRLVSTTRPDGVTTTVTRTACAAECPEGAAAAVRSTAPGAPSITLYLDALGRERRRETEGFDGRSVRVDVELDTRGLVVSETRPYFAGDGAYATRFERDPLGRPIRALAPDGSETRWSYAAREVSVTDALGHVATERRDARGALAERIDALGGATRYAWDAFGNVVQIRDALGNETRFVYDQAGRRIARIDPDLGAWSFAYDALGQLVAQLDARGGYVHLAYDRLGRLVRREGDGPAAFWLWDGAEHGVGKLARVSTADGSFAREERYDAFGRSTSTTTRIGRDAFELSRTYDQLGRTASLRYPTGFAVSYAYTPTGSLDAITSADGVVYWQAEERTADGRVMRERLGNGLETDRIFDPRTGRLERIATIEPTGAAIQALRLAWDLGGNLSSRADDVAGSSETFGYDALGRLTGATSAGAGTTSFAYDAIGNLTYKTDVGVYQYAAPGEPRPHAVLRAGDDPRALEYDANGNLLSEPSGRALIWSARNQPLAIATPGSGFDFLSYAPTGEPITRLEIATGASPRSSFTVQVGDSFEQATDLVSHRVEQRHLIHAEGVLVAVRVGCSGASETRYVHRDHLESTTAMSDAAGVVLERTAYDSYGASEPPPSVAPRGYAGHISLEHSRLVHMRGRVYDPSLGRFLSPDPVAPVEADPAALNRYAYVAGNPLRFVDPTGYLSAQAPSAGPSIPTWGVESIRLGVADAGSFLSAAWGNVRFAASALWNGVAWLAAQAGSVGRWLGGSVVAGVAWAWTRYDSFHAGILPDSRTPFGLFESLIRGIVQADDEATLYYLGRDANGELLPPVPFEGRFEGGNLVVTGQCLELDEAVAKARNLVPTDDFYLLPSPTVNLLSDSIESAFLKLAPSQLSRQLARVLEQSTSPVNLIGYSQGALQVYWALTLATESLGNVSVGLVGPAISSISYRIALSSSGAIAGGRGYQANWNDPVPNLLGINLEGGWALPVLLPLRTLGSILFTPTLFLPEYSVHGSYH